MITRLLIQGHVALVKMMQDLVYHVLCKINP